MVPLLCSLGFLTAPRLRVTAVVLVITADVCATGRKSGFGGFVRRKFRWGLSELFLYLLSVPIIFILIGLLAVFIAYLVIVIFNVRHGITVFFYLWMFFMFFFGAPLSLLLSFFVPPFVLRWIHKRRLRRLMRGRS